MGRKQLTDKERNDITERARNGERYRHIARHYDRDIRTIKNVVTMKGERRRSRLSKGEKVQIIELVIVNPSITSKEIISHLELDACIATVCRYLQKKGYSGGCRRYPKREVAIESDTEQASADI